MIENKIDFANNLRGFAALSVVLSHLMSVFWLRPMDVAAMTGNPAYNGHAPIIATWIAALSPFSFGSFGVALFFIISGFVIPFSLKKYSKKQFLVARFFRIYPTYLVGFLVLLGILYLGCQFYHHAYPQAPATLFFNSILAWDIFSYPCVDGINWTLQIEIKFYLICALFAASIRQNRYKNILLIASSFLLVTIFSVVFATQLNGLLAHQRLINLIYVFQQDSMTIAFMFIGVILHFYYFKAINKTQAMLSIFYLFSVVSTIWYIGHWQDTAFSNLFSYLLALILFIACYFGRNKIKFHWIFAKLANISYSLYIVHAMSNYVIMRILLSLGFSPYWVILIALLYAFAAATLLNRLIEIPSNNFGKKIAAMLGSDSGKKYKTSVLN